MANKNIFVAKLQNHFIIISLFMYIITFNLYCCPFIGNCCRFVFLENKYNIHNMVIQKPQNGKNKHEIFQFGIFEGKAKVNVLLMWPLCDYSPISCRPMWLTKRKAFKWLCTLERRKIEQQTWTDLIRPCFQRWAPATRFRWSRWEGSCSSWCRPSNSGQDQVE